MKHLGDITKINGANVPPVNVVIGGSPCQDLSVAGRREGLKGERSGLFMEQIRIIKEMRLKSERSGATDIKPRYMVWENVPGAFSSNKGQDFKAVLEEVVKVVKKDCPDIPIPEGGWHYSGCIVGDGFSVAWRVFDAQFWGVPQRRRRIALVADFGGTTAPEILFECESVSGDITQSGTAWKEFTAAVEKRFNSSNRVVGQEHAVAYSFDSLSSNSMKSNNPNSGCREVDVAKTVDTTIPNPSKNQGGICILNDQGGSVMGVQQNVEKSPTLRAETHGHVPTVYDARGNGDGKTTPTITEDHNNRVTDYTALCVRERCGCDGGGKGLLIQKDKSGTLAANNDQFTVCIGNGQADQLKPSEKAGTLNCMHDQQAIITLDRAAFNQGINAQYDPKISEDGINSTRAGFCNGIVNALCARDYKGVGNQYVDEGKLIIQSNACVAYAALKANTGGKAHGIGYEIQKVPTLSAENNDASVVSKSIVRRLTPLECERLQGFPDGWTDIGEYIDTNGKKRKTSDSARHKALGNSIALPSWVWVLERISNYCGTDKTMASLFDGIGGFPLIWETLNGKGTCLWASEIEEFPIAVTKYHFKGESNDKQIYRATAG